MMRRPSPRKERSSGDNLSEYQLPCPSSVKRHNFGKCRSPGWCGRSPQGGLMVEFSVVVVRGSLLRLAVQTGLGPVEVEGRVVWTAATRGIIRHGLVFSAPKGPDFAAEWHLAEGQSCGATALET